MQDTIRCEQRAVIVFIDFKSAFDNVHWPALSRVLESKHVPRKVMAVVLLRNSAKVASGLRLLRNSAIVANSLE